MDALGVEVISAKARVAKCVIPKTCSDCAGPCRRHKRQVCQIYLTEKEWNTFRDAQVRAFGVNADAQKRITNAFSNDACLRETALVSVVPTLLAMPNSGRSHVCCGQSWYEFSCYVGKWEWVNTLEKVGALTDKPMEKEVPPTNIPPTPVDDTPCKTDSEDSKDSSDASLLSPCATMMATPNEVQDMLYWGSSVGSQKGDDYEVALSTVCDAYSEMLSENKTIKCVTTDNKKAHSEHAKIVYKGNVDLLNAELGKKAPFADIGSDKVYFSDRDGACCIGPLFLPSITWDNKATGSINTTITNRTVRKYEYKWNSPTAMRYTKAASAMLINWFTEENIREAENEFALHANKPRKWSDRKFLEAIISLERDNKIMGLDWMQKAEVAFAQGKSGRCIQNEGEGRCVRNLEVMFIIEYVIFEKIAKHFNIKHADKRVVLDRLTKRLSQKRYSVSSKGFIASSASHLCMIGIDQSAFDFSELVGGLLNAEINIITKILTLIHPDSSKEWQEEMIAERKHYKMTGAFTMKDTSGFLSILVEAHRTRASGDRGTSVLNWIVEFLSTICCIFEYPEMIVIDMANGTLNSRWYKTLFSDEKAVIYSLFEGCFEGDDGLLQLVRNLLMHIKTIEENFHEIGLNCKLEHSEYGQESVIEFVGCHLLVTRGGHTYWGKHHGGAFVPCINKAILKSSWTLSRGKIADVATSSYWSRMLQFAGKQTWVAGYFRQMSQAWGGQVQAELMDKWAGVDDDLSSSPLPDDIQRKLLLFSTGAHDDRQFEFYEHDHQPTDNAGDIIYDFPLGLQNKMRSLCNVNGATHKHGSSIEKPS